MSNRKGLAEEVRLYHLHEAVSQLARNLYEEGRAGIAEEIWVILDKVGLARVPDQDRGERLEELLQKNKALGFDDKDPVEEISTKLEAMRNSIQAEIDEREKLHESRLRDQVALLALDRIVTHDTSKGLVVNTEATALTAFRLASAFMKERKK